MPKLLARIVALFLVPCLIAEPFHFERSPSDFVGNADSRPPLQIFFAAQALAPESTQAFPGPVGIPQIRAESSEWSEPAVRPAAPVTEYVLPAPHYPAGTLLQPPAATAPSKGSPSTLAWFWEWLYPGDYHENIMGGYRETLWLGWFMLESTLIGAYHGVPGTTLVIRAMIAGALWGLAHLAGTYIAATDAIRKDPVVVRHLFTREWRTVLRTSLGKTIGGTLWLGVAAAFVLLIWGPDRRHSILPLGLAILAGVLVPPLVGHLHDEENGCWLIYLYRARYEAGAA